MMDFGDTMEVRDFVERLPLGDISYSRTWRGNDMYVRLPSLRSRKISFDRTILVEFGFDIIVYAHDFLDSAC